MTGVHMETDERKGCAALNKTPSYDEAASVSEDTEMNQLLLWGENGQKRSKKKS